MTDAKIRLLQIVTRIDVGGVPEHLLTLIEGLQGQNYAVSVACNHITDPMRQRFTALGVDIYLIKLHRLPHPADLLSAWQLYQFLRREQFAIVHTHMSKAALLGGLMARFARIPVIVNTAHNLGCIAFTKHWQRALFWLYDKALFALTMDAVILVSENIRRQIVANRLLPEHKAVYIPNGIKTNDLVQTDKHKILTIKKSLDINPTHWVLGTVARLVWFKGLHTLFAAMPDILKAHPDTTLLVIGDGPLKQELEGQARELGISEAIRFLGERNDVADLLVVMDMFVLPSVSEGMPITILEAMSTALPVVATNVGGIPELVVDGQTGFLVSREQPNALAQAVIKLLGDENLRKKMGNAGKGRVAHVFSSRYMVAETARLYSRLLKSKNKR